MLYRITAAADCNIKKVLKNRLIYRGYYTVAQS